MNAPFEYPGSELDVFAGAARWKRYFAAHLRPFIRGRVLEVGAGIGAVTRTLCTGSEEAWTCLEPDARLAARLRDTSGRPGPAGLPPVRVLNGTIASLSPGRRLRHDPLRRRARTHRRRRPRAARRQPPAWPRRPPDRALAGASVVVLSVRRGHRASPAIQSPQSAGGRAPRFDAGPTAISRQRRPVGVAGESTRPPIPTPQRASDRPLGPGDGSHVASPRSVARLHAGEVADRRVAPLEAVELTITWGTFPTCQARWKRAPHFRESP